MSDLQGILESQLNYYKDRAKEYDEWWDRVGRFSGGAEKDKEWNDDIASARTLIRSWMSKEDEVLELACGTGIWTKFLAEEVDVAKMNCIDGTAETIEVLKAKFILAGIQDKLKKITFGVEDIFGAWMPQQGASKIFFGFFLTHVPPSKMAQFVNKLKHAAGGKRAEVILIDSFYTSDQRATAKDYTLREGVKAVDYDATAPDEKFLIYRKLNDGATHSIVKVFFEPQVLKDVFASFGMQGETHLTPNRNFLLARFVIEATN